MLPRARLLDARFSTWLLVLVLALALGMPRRAVAEDLAMAGGPIASALAILADEPATSGLRTVLDANRVAIRFAAMTPGIYARYSVARHAIEIDDRWSLADNTTLAAVIAHEATHAADAVNGSLAAGGAVACIESEIKAFQASAELWRTIHGPNGKPQPSHELERQLNLIAERYAVDPAGLERLVRDAYSDQCGH